MNDGITLVYYIFNHIIDVLFNKMEIVSGVTVGWILVSLMIMSIISHALLNIVSVKSISGIDRIKREKENES